MRILFMMATVSTVATASIPDCSGRCSTTHNNTVLHISQNEGVVKDSPVDRTYPYYSSQHQLPSRAYAERLAIVSNDVKPSCDSPATSRDRTRTSRQATSTIAIQIAHTTSYHAVISKWRSRMGLSGLAISTKLEGNAMDTVVSGNGRMVHKLLPGSYGQVLAPGNANNFETVYVGGWLCEIPTLSGLHDVCSTLSQGWAYGGQIGHAEILASEEYTKIGCALFAGVWCCDLS
jgi:hypothetical protein